MKLTKPYHIACRVLLVALLISGCGSGKRMNNRITLWRNDKIPYGTWYAYEQLNHIFPEATIRINKSSPSQYKSLVVTDLKKYEDDAGDVNSRTAYIIVTGKVIPDEHETAALLNMVANGQNVFISAMRVGDLLLDSLHLKTSFTTHLLDFQDSLTVSVNNPETNDSLSFTYPGIALDDYFESYDSSITTVLGRDRMGHPNFVRFSYDGGGSLFIHLAPTALTNFFLLHKNNKAYYDNVFSYLPEKTQVVRWDEYFRYHVLGSENRNGKGFSALTWPLSQRGLSTALPLLILLLLILYLFESKRKQRIIPVIAPLKNASLDFVKTIGRLYFQRRDNKNLAQKMAIHFADHVRNRYNIRNAITDPEFEKRLAWKTGYDAEALHRLVSLMKMVQDAPSVSEQGLLELNRKLEHFYKYA